MGKHKRSADSAASNRDPSAYHLFAGAKILRRIQADVAELSKRGYRIAKVTEKTSGLVREITDDEYQMDISGAIEDERHGLYFQGAQLSEEDAQLLSPEEASELLGISSAAAVYQRIYRAKRRGKPHPFWKPEGSRSYLAHRVDILEWGKTLTGKKQVRVSGKHASTTTAE